MESLDPDSPHCATVHGSSVRTSRPRTPPAVQEESETTTALSARCRSLGKRGRCGYDFPVTRLPANPDLPDAEFFALLASLRHAGITAQGLTPLAGDASSRRFFRLHLPTGGSLVAAWYPHELASAADHDRAVHRWAAVRGLPVPRPAGAGPRLLVSEDVGPEDISVTGPGLGDSLAGGVIDALAAYQRTPWCDAPNPAFNAPFFRAELAVFTAHAMAPRGAIQPETERFLDRLAESVASHPVSLVHRDFHANNLFYHLGRIWTVDFQDLRGGPDTYDLASLLRERGGGALIRPADGFLREAAAKLGWRGDWQRRFVECAAQRGLKVIGTFLRLAAAGKPDYFRFLPEVVAATHIALDDLSAPVGLTSALADMAVENGYHGS